MTAASSAIPVTLDDLAVLDDHLRGALAAADAILFAAGDAASEGPVMPLAAQRADVDRHGAALRALLRISRTKIDALRALVHLANDRRTWPRRGKVRDVATTPRSRREA